MGLSPSTVFHFTDKRGLKGILKENFRIKYCREKVLTSEEFDIGVPMVSFCDIRISELKDHIGKFGNYGIGLSKSWAKDKGLNPVLYVNKSSPYARKLTQNILDLLDEKDIDDDLSYNMLDTLRYLKSYEGELIRDGKIVEENYRFADEREWRYVPEMSGRTFDDYLIEDELNDPKIIQKKNRQLGTERLYFNANQILYLIVKEENEIEEIINHIRNVKSKNYSLSEVERLMTRIISCERIFNDF